jgi:hypothetical protein
MYIMGHKHIIEIEEDNDDKVLISENAPFSQIE